MRAVADDRRGDPDARMGLSRAGSVDEDRVTLGVQEGAGREFLHLAKRPALSVTSAIVREQRGGERILRRRRRRGV